MKAEQPILIVDDDVVDSLAIRRALDELRVTNPVYMAQDGRQALNLLLDPTTLTPCLLILDLNMPGMDGLTFLKCVKHHQTLRRIPVVVLSGCTEREAVGECFDLGVAGYMAKPVEYEELLELVRIAMAYWKAGEIPDAE